MTNHPNRGLMHHFRVMADAETGEWDISTAEYLGMIEKSVHYARADTDDEHYDQHDGEGLDQNFWEAAEVPPTEANVAMTVVWHR
jgi:hypothetical protein